MKNKIGKKFVDMIGGKAYLYTLVSSPDGHSFNLLGENNKLLFFHSVPEQSISSYLKDLKEIS